MAKGAFIVVEGLEGAGKSSVIALIRQVVENLGKTVVSTREPGGTPMAEAIRDCVKADWHGEQITQETELLLMYAARSQLVTNIIIPALERGEFVVGDRHDMSSQAYQGGGRQIPIKYLQQLKDMTLQGFSPDLTLYLDVDPVIGLQRANQRGALDRIELAGDAFFARTREAYQVLVANDPNALSIDANRDMQIVHQEVSELLTDWLKRFEGMA